METHVSSKSITTPSGHTISMSLTVIENDDGTHTVQYNCDNGGAGDWHELVWLYYSKKLRAEQPAFGLISNYSDKPDDPELPHHGEVTWNPRAWDDKAAWITYEARLAINQTNEYPQPYPESISVDPISIKI